MGGRALAVASVQVLVLQALEASTTQKWYIYIVLVIVVTLQVSYLLLATPSFYILKVQLPYDISAYTQLHSLYWKKKNCKLNQQECQKFSKWLFLLPDKGLLTVWFILQYQTTHTYVQPLSSYLHWIPKYILHCGAQILSQTTSIMTIADVDGMDQQIVTNLCL